MKSLIIKFLFFNYIKIEIGMTYLIFGIIVGIIAGIIGTLLSILIKLKLTCFGLFIKKYIEFSKVNKSFIVGIKFFILFIINI